MDLNTLENRKVELQASLKNIEQSYHMVTGHLAEVTYQISVMTKEAEEKSTQGEECLAVMDNLPVE